MGDVGSSPTLGLPFVFIGLHLYAPIPTFTSLLNDPKWIPAGFPTEDNL